MTQFSLSLSRLALSLQIIFPDMHTYLFSAEKFATKVKRKKYGFNEWHDSFMYQIARQAFVEYTSGDGVTQWGLKDFFQPRGLIWDQQILVSRLITCSRIKRTKIRKNNTLKVEYGLVGMGLSSYQDSNTVYSWRSTTLYLLKYRASEIFQGGFGFSRPDTVGSHKVSDPKTRL